MPTPIKFQSQVINVTRHSPDVATYEFRYLDRRPRFKAGQFLHLTLDDFDSATFWPDSRVFSIASGVANRDIIRLTISAKGQYTTRILDELEVGRQVWMKGPYGDFIVKTDPEKETVFIAGGTGIAPFVAFMEDALVQGCNDKVWLHYGARESRLLNFKALSDRCAVEIPNFNVSYYLEENTGHEAYSGRIHLERICDQLEDVHNTTFYLCGPIEMVQSFSQCLQEDYRVLVSEIKLDDWE